MQRKLVMNTALCATLCQAINTRSLIQATNEELAGLGIDLEWQIPALAQTQNQMATATEALANVTGLAQVQQDVCSGSDPDQCAADAAADAELHKGEAEGAKAQLVALVGQLGHATAALSAAGAAAPNHLSEAQTYHTRVYAEL